MKPTITVASQWPEKKPLRPHLPVEVAIYAAACLVEDCEALRHRAEQVMAALQTVAREQREKR